MTKLHVVVLILLNEKNQLLISQRQKGQTFSGFWEFPGGKVEVGESAIKALQREILEELNYDLTQPKPFEIIEHKYQDFAVHLESWICRSNKPTVQANEGQKLKWININEIGNYKFPEANQNIISKLQSL